MIKFTMVLTSAVVLFAIVPAANAGKLGAVKLQAEPQKLDATTEAKKLDVDTKKAGANAPTDRAAAQAVLGSSAKQSSGNGKLFKQILQHSREVPVDGEGGPHADMNRGSCIRC